MSNLNLGKNHILLDPSNTVFFPSSTITQLVDINTGVELNSTSGVITTISAAVVANASETFTVTNNTVTTSSIIIVGIQDYAGTFSTNGIPVVNVNDLTAGTFDITISNSHNANALNGILQISFIII